MSNDNEKKPSSEPFKIVTVEYFEDFESNNKNITPDWQRPADMQLPGPRRIRVVTTTRRYNLESSKGDPIVYVTYEYL